MEKKSTDQLFQGFGRTKDTKGFIKENKEEFLNQSMQQYLNSLIDARGMKVADVVRDSGLSKSYVYKIFNEKKNLKIQPDRDKLIAIAFGIGLSCGETSVLLKRTGYRELYARDKRDGIIIHSLINSKKIIECNNLLYDEGLAGLE